MPAKQTFGKIDYLKRWSEMNSNESGELETLMELPDNIIIGGMDLASRVDHSALFLLQWNGVKLSQYGSAVWPHIDYPVIATDVRAINEKFPMHKLGFDETGNIAVSALFGQDLEGILEPIHLTNPLKIDAVRVVNYLSQLGMLEIEPDDPVIREIEEQQKVISDAGFERYEHPQGVHDDRFWALAIACYVAVEFVIGLPPAAIESGYEAVDYGNTPDEIVENIMQHAKWGSF